MPMSAQSQLLSPRVTAGIAEGKMQAELPPLCLSELYAPQGKGSDCPR